MKDSKAPSAGCGKLLIFLLSVAFMMSVTPLSAQKVLHQSDLDKAKSVFVIDNDFDLAGETITIPKGVKISFKGGHIENGIIIGNSTRLYVDQDKPAFGLNLTIKGKWLIKDVYDKWFDFNPEPTYKSNRIIKNILALSNDDTRCHIHFDEDRVYYFELPYKGRPDIWNIVSLKTENGKSVRRYDDIYDEKYADLRIFTIPSNTHVTINNTLKMLPTRAGAYFIFWEYDKENITVDGQGAIYGECKEHFYMKNQAGEISYSGEWGMIFLCRKCRNFVFKDITLSDALGDCLSFGGSRYDVESGHREGRNLTVENVNIKFARRNGISIGATNAIIKDCFFEGCGIDDIYGTAPRAAIDFEPSYIKSYPEIGNRNVVMKNCSFKNNKYDVSSTYNNLINYRRTATTISNCVFTAPIRFNATYWIKFKKCKIPSFTNWRDNIAEDTPFKYIKFVNCEIDNISSVIMTPSWRNKFRNCVIHNKIE